MMPPAPTPVPVSDLAPMPTNEEIFGNSFFQIQRKPEIYLRHCQIIHNNVLHYIHSIFNICMLKKQFYLFRQFHIQTIHEILIFFYHLHCFFIFVL